ncbi:hypothetical protein A6J60_003155 [Psychrobacter sp. FDAARGOS_221]|nr:hypothetical protein A6J60_003155 [Psychrobacter sp. FDAARGOS_221]
MPSIIRATRRFQSFITPIGFAVLMTGAITGCQTTEGLSGPASTPAQSTQTTQTPNSSQNQTPSVITTTPNDSQNTTEQTSHTSGSASTPTSSPSPTEPVVIDNSQTSATTSTPAQPKPDNSPSSAEPIAELPVETDLYRA